MNISIGQWVVLLLAALCAPVAAAGLDTDSLDQTFGEGGDGRQVLDVPGEATAVAIDAEDRIVLLGSGVNQRFVARLDANGAADPTFATLQIPNFDGEPKLGLESIAFRSDGTIVAAGHWFGEQGQACDEGCWAICQITQTGELDANFGDDETPGCARPTDEPGSAATITIQPDGKLLLAGATAGKRAAVRRFHADGSIDPSFGAGGIFVLHEQYGESNFRSLHIGSNGMIAAAGEVELQAYQGNMVVALLTMDGQLVPEFAGGVRIVGFDSPQVEQSRATSVRVLNGGRVLLAGYIRKGPPNLDRLPAVTLLDGKGNLMPSYGESGQRIFDFCVVMDCRDFQSVVTTIETSGRVFLAGRVETSEFDGLIRLYAMRITTDGEIDSAFGTNDGAFVPGVASVFWPDSSGFEPYAATLQQDKLVLAGQHWSTPQAPSRPAAIRLDNGILFADDFETD